MEKDSCNEHFFVFSLHSTFKIFLEKSPVSPWPWIQCWKNDLTLFLSNNSWALLKLNHRSGQQEMYIWNPTSLYMRSSVLTYWEQFTFISFFRLKKKKSFKHDIEQSVLHSLYNLEITESQKSWNCQGPLEIQARGQLQQVVVSPVRFWVSPRK